MHGSLVLLCLQSNKCIEVQFTINTHTQNILRTAVPCVFINRTQNILRTAVPCVFINRTQNILRITVTYVFINRLATDGTAIFWSCQGENTTHPLNGYYFIKREHCQDILA